MGTEVEAEAHYCIGYQLPAPSDLQTTGTWQHELWQLDLFLLKPAILILILPNSSVAQLNPSSVGQPEKHSAINNFILDHKVDIFCITESWLHPSGDEAKCADLAPPDTTPSPAPVPPAVEASLLSCASLCVLTSPLPLTFHFSILPLNFWTGLSTFINIICNSSASTVHPLTRGINLLRHSFLNSSLICLNTVTPQKAVCCLLAI